MRRFGIGAAILAFVFINGCKDDTGPDKEPETGQRCSTSSNCRVGDVCEGGFCVEWEGCTPDSCGSGEICDENFQCVSVTDKCELSPGGCECHILNGARGFNAGGTTTLVLPAGASTDVVAVLATKMGVALPGALFESTVTGDTFTNPSGHTITAVAGSGGESSLSVSFLNTNATCEASLKNLGDAPSGDNVRFYVVNDLTHGVISGARVVVDTNNDGSDDGGAPVTSSEGLSTTTNGVGSGTYNVTVFATGYNILSIAGLKAGDGKDITLPLSARTENPPTGGFTGRMDFTGYEKRYRNSRAAAIKVGLATGSIPLQALLNFSLDLFIGTVTEADCDETPEDPGCYAIAIPGVDAVFALPSGLVLGLGALDVKPHFDSVARPGRRFAFGVGGELEFEDITGLVGLATPFLADCACDQTDSCDADGASECECDTDCGFNIDLGAVLKDVVPLLPNFATGLIGNLALPEAPMTEWQAHINSDYATGRTSDVRFPKLDDGSDNYGQLSLREGWSNFTSLAAPALPNDWGAAESGGKMEGFISLTGVDAVGYGFVPLGLGVGLDCTEGNCLDRTAADAGTFDGVVNGGPVCKFNPDPAKNRCSPTVMAATNNTGELADGKLGLFHAPAFGGLEGYGSKTLTLALPVSDLLDLAGAGGLRATGVVHTGALPNGESDNIKNLAFPGKPGIPTALAGRTYTPIESGHNMHWVTLATATATDGSLTTRWNVYFAGIDGFTAPAFPTDMNLGTDPFTADADAESDIPVGSVNSTHMGFNLEGVTVQELAANNGTSITSFFDAVTGLSIVSTNIPVQ